MTFSPEINLGHILTAIGLLAGFFIFSVRVTRRVEEAERCADEACERANKAHERIELLNGSFSAYRETMASQVVTRENFRADMREMEGRLTEIFKQVSERVEKFTDAMQRRTP